MVYKGTSSEATNSEPARNRARSSLGWSAGRFRPTSSLVAHPRQAPLPRKGPFVWDARHELQAASQPFVTLVVLALSVAVRGLTTLPVASPLLHITPYRTHPRSILHSLLAEKNTHTPAKLKTVLRYLSCHLSEHARVGHRSAAVRSTLAKERLHR